MAQATLSFLIGVGRFDWREAQLIALFGSSVLLPMHAGLLVARVLLFIVWYWMGIDYDGAGHMHHLRNRSIEGYGYSFFGTSVLVCPARTHVCMYACAFAALAILSYGVVRTSVWIIDR